jgi:hypothetical protein
MEIYRLPRYVKDLKRIGATDADRDKLETEIVSRPLAGNVIKGLRGIRKIRFSVRGSGKSGGARAIYWIMTLEHAGKIFMLTAYAKNEQADLTSEQRKALVKVIEEIENG